MPQSLYIADPAVAAQYHVAPGEWVEIADDAEAAWLIANKHAGTLDHYTALPEAGFVHPEAPVPFVPYGTDEIGPPIEPPPPAVRRVVRKPPLPEGQA
jgi:hypothetical protein